MEKKYNCSISVVSHGQGALVKNLLADFQTFCGPSFEVLLTLNIPESKAFLSDFEGLAITLIENDKPQGFGQNHNAAFKMSSGEVFIIVNPDIRAPNLNLTSLYALASRPGVGACAPRVFETTGQPADSARYFPTIVDVFLRVFPEIRKLDYNFDVSEAIEVDWVAGMFVAFPKAAFQEVGGFDQRYFMYWEDADICRRLKHNGYQTFVDCSTSVVHNARRANRRSLRHFSWYLRSATRFLVGV